MPKESSFNSPERLLQALDFSAELTAKDDAYHEARRALLLELLELADSFDRLESAESSGDIPTVGSSSKRTVRLIARQLDAVLHRAGVVPIICVGQPFDPAQHEIVEIRDAPGFEDGTILHEVRRGYRLESRVLRQPRVIMARSLQQPPS